MHHQDQARMVGVYLNNKSEFLLPYFSHCRTKESFVNVEIICKDGEKAFGHMLYMSKVSKFLETLFQPHANEPKVVVMLPEYDYRSVQQALSLMYTGCVNLDASMASFFPLLRALGVPLDKFNLLPTHPAQTEADKDEASNQNLKRRWSNGDSPTNEQPASKMMKQNISLLYPDRRSLDMASKQGGNTYQQHDSTGDGNQQDGYTEQQKSRHFSQGTGTSNADGPISDPQSSVGPMIMQNAPSQNGIWSELQPPKIYFPENLPPASNNFFPVPNQQTIPTGDPYFFSDSVTITPIQRKSMWPNSNQLYPENYPSIQNQMAEYLRKLYGSNLNVSPLDGRLTQQENPFQSHQGNVLPGNNLDHSMTNFGTPQPMLYQAAKFPDSYAHLEGRFNRFPTTEELPTNYSKVPNHVQELEAVVGDNLNGRVHPSTQEPKSTSEEASKVLPPEERVQTKLAENPHQAPPSYEIPVPDGQQVQAPLTQMPPCYECGLVVESKASLMKHLIVKHFLEEFRRIYSMLPTGICCGKTYEPKQFTNFAFHYGLGYHNYIFSLIPDDFKAKIPTKENRAFRSIKSENDQQEISLPPCPHCEVQTKTTRAMLSHLMSTHYLDQFRALYEQRNQECCGKSFAGSKFMNFVLHYGYKHRYIYELMPTGYYDQLTSVRNERRNTKRSPILSKTLNIKSEPALPLPPCFYCGLQINKYRNFLNHLICKHFLQDFKNIAERNDYRCCNTVFEKEQTVRYALHCSIGYDNLRSRLPEEFRRQLELLDEQSNQHAPKIEPSELPKAEKMTENSDILPLNHENQLVRHSVREKPIKKKPVVPLVPPSCTLCGREEKTYRELLRHLSYHYSKRFKKIYNRLNGVCPCCQKAYTPHSLKKGHYAVHLGATHKMVIDYVPLEMKNALLAIENGGTIQRGDIPLGDEEFKELCEKDNQNELEETKEEEITVNEESENEHVEEKSSSYYSKDSVTNDSGVKEEPNEEQSDGEELVIDLEREAKESEHESEELHEVKDAKKNDTKEKLKAAEEFCHKCAKGFLNKAEMNDHILHEHYRHKFDEMFERYGGVCHECTGSSQAIFQDKREYRVHLQVVHKAIPDDDVMMCAECPADHRKFFKSYQDFYRFHYLPVHKGVVAQ